MHLRELLPYFAALGGPLRRLRRLDRRTAMCPGKAMKAAMPLWPGRTVRNRNQLFPFAPLVHYRADGVRAMPPPQEGKFATWQR